MPIPRTLLRAFLCALCVSAVNLSPVFAGDEALLPPMSRAELAQEIIEARREAARASDAESRACLRDFERARSGRVARLPAEVARLKDGVAMDSSPPLFESMQRKGSWLRELRARSDMERRRAEYLAGASCDWLPEIDLHRTLAAGGPPMVGAVGLLSQSAEIPTEWGPAHERLGLRVLSSDPDGSAMVVAEMQRNTLQYDMNFPRAPGKDPPSWVESKVEPVNYFVLRGCPDLSRYASGARLPQPLEGVWRVVGTTTYRTQFGALRTTLVLERQCSIEEAHAAITDHLKRNPPPPEPATTPGAPGAPTTPTPSPPPASSPP